MNISFKANYILPTNILKKDNGKYEKYSANFYKLNIKNHQDITLIKDLAKTWGKDSYVFNILDSATDQNINYPRHIYILTDAKESNYKPKTENVMGIAELDETRKTENSLNFIQVNPKFINSKKYNHIGSAMIDVIKCLHFSKPMYVFSEENAMNFYKYNNFEKIENSDYEFCWYG